MVFAPKNETISQKDLMIQAYKEKYEEIKKFVDDVLSGSDEWNLKNEHSKIYNNIEDSCTVMQETLLERYQQIENSKDLISWTELNSMVVNWYDNVRDGIVKDIAST